MAAAALAGCSDGAAPPANKADSAAVATKSAPAPAAADSADLRLVVAFGDSLYAGYNLKQNEGFAPELEKALIAKGIAARVFNAGVSGDTSAAGLQRLGFVLDGLPRKPDLVIVGLGGNDMLRGIAPEQTRANMEAILAGLDRRGIPAMLTGMIAAPNLGADYAGKFNPIFPELAAKHDAALYPFFLDGVVTNPALMQADHIHPTAQGIDAIVARVAPVVAGALDKEG